MKTKTPSKKTKSKSIMEEAFGNVADEVRTVTLLNYVMPVNIAAYRDLRGLEPVDGDGSSKEEEEINARRDFISKRKWHDFGIISTIPQLKSVRTGEPKDSRLFEVRNTDGMFAQATVINSPKNEGGVYAHQKLFMQLQEAWLAAEAAGKKLHIKTSTRGVWNATSSKEDFMWFNGVQAIFL